MKLRPRKQHPKGLVENQLINDLYKIIEDRRNTLKRVASSELVTLFWKIGTELNNLLNKKNETQADKVIIRTISENLSTKYGPYFTEKSLNKMRLFADTFHDFIELQQYIHFLSWEHLLVLLKLKKKRRKGFLFDPKNKTRFECKRTKNGNCFE